MKDFSGRIAVITGGGTGMGRALARQLVAEGCDVAMCDVSAANMAESIALCEAEAPQGVRTTSFVCDVSDAPQMDAFAEHVQSAFDTDHINLLFNNAGITGIDGYVGGVLGGTPDDSGWRKTFDVNLHGVVNILRVFVPQLVEAGPLPSGRPVQVVTTSSVMGLYDGASKCTAATSRCRALTLRPSLQWA